MRRYFALRLLGASYLLGLVLVAVIGGPVTGGEFGQTEQISPTPEEADALYAQRGEDGENSNLAASMYGQLAITAADDLDKARLLIKQTRALYYFGEELEKERKGAGKSVFKECYAAADAVVQLFQDPESMEEEEQKALGLFQYGACYGLAHKETSLSEVRRAMNSIIDLGYHEDIFYYGVDRALGRIHYFLPWYVGGDKELCKERHKRAFENTLVSDDVRVSVYGLNNLYYADILAHKSFKKIDLACEILQTFIQQDPQTLLKSRIPETIYEIEQAKEKIRLLECPVAEGGVEVVSD